MTTKEKIETIIELLEANPEEREVLLKALEVSGTLDAVADAAIKDKKSATELETVKDPRIITRKVLAELGTPCNGLGYTHLTTAIPMVVENPKIGEAITKTLYPAVAKVCGTTPSRVERAMRHAIEVTWERGDLDVFDKYFGNTVSPSKGKPTNSEFIARLAEIVRFRMEGVDICG